MREELLDHLTGIYAEEFQRAGDIELAVRRVKQRFGDPQELTWELRESVSRWDCVARVLDLDRPRPGESLLHLAFRHLLASSVCMTGVSMLVLPLTCLRGRSGEIGPLIHILFVICLFSTAFSFMGALLAGQMSQTLYGRRTNRPWRALIWQCLASLAVLPILLFLAYSGLFGNVAAGFSGILLGWIVAPAAPFS
jgi:hypothetical protein